MNKITVVFHTRGSIDDAQQEAIKQLEAMDQVDLTVILERQSGRQANTLFDEIVRLWRRFGMYSIIFVAQRLLTRFQNNVSNNEESVAIESEVITVEDIHSESSIHRLQNLEPHLGIVYGHKILKPSVFTVPKFDTIGIHWGNVPDYRGKWCIFWEMYHGEQSTAITFQVINEGIDTGRIIKQVPIDIRPTDTLSAVKDRVRTATATELPEIVDRYIETDGDIETKEQESGGSLYTDPKLRHRIIFRLRRVVQRLLR